MRRAGEGVVWKALPSSLKAQAGPARMGTEGPINNQQPANVLMAAEAPLCPQDGDPQGTPGVVVEGAAFFFALSQTSAAAGLRCYTAIAVGGLHYCYDDCEAPQGILIDVVWWSMLVLELTSQCPSSNNAMARGRCASIAVRDIGFHLVCVISDAVWAGLHFLLQDVV